MVIFQTEGMYNAPMPMYERNPGYFGGTGQLMPSSSVYVPEHSGQQPMQYYGVSQTTINNLVESVSGITNFTSLAPLPTLEDRLHTYESVAFDPMFSQLPEPYSVPEISLPEPKTYDNDFLAPSMFAKRRQAVIGYEETYTPTIINYSIEEINNNYEQISRENDMVQSAMNNPVVARVLAVDEFMSGYRDTMNKYVRSSDDSLSGTPSSNYLAGTDYGQLCNLADTDYGRLCNSMGVSQIPLPSNRKEIVRIDNKDFLKTVYSYGCDE